MLLRGFYSLTVDKSTKKCFDGYKNENMYAYYQSHLYR